MPLLVLLLLLKHWRSIVVDGVFLELDTFGTSIDLLPLFLLRVVVGDVFEHALLGNLLSLLLVKILLLD